MRRSIQRTLAGLLLLTGAHAANAGEVREDFEAYAVQLDTTGVFDAVEGATYFFVTSDGSTPADVDDTAKVVAAASEALAGGAGIADDSGNRLWVLNSSAGSTGFISGQNGHVLVADIGADQPAGPLGAFFAGGAKDLTGATLSYDIRETTGNASTTFRFLLIDAADNEIWTAPFALTTGFQTITVSMNDFTTILDGGVSFDFTQIIGVGLDVFTTPGSAPALTFHVDNVVLELPVVEDFQAYPLQLDNTGLVVEDDPGVFETYFTVTTDGLQIPGPDDTSTLVAAMAQEVLGASAGIVDNAGEKAWQISSSSGATGSISGQNGHVMAAAIGAFAGSGPIATLFDGRVLDMTDGTVSFDIRETTGAAATSFRFWMLSGNEEEIWFDPIALSTAFQTFTVTDDDFTTILDGGVSFDFTRVEEIGLDIFTTPSATAPALSFEIDTFRVLAESRLAVASDLDGDAMSDILWRNSGTGATIAWQMDGFTKLAAGGLGTVGLVWQVVDLGDFTGDGKADILWRNTSTGNVLAWEMDGFTKVSTATIGSAVSAWQIAGLGDFTGDGKADILWRNTATGSALAWEMDGFTKMASATIGTASLDWQIVRLGDYDGDGQADVLWRNTVTGQDIIWLMNGLVKDTTGSIGAVATAWQVQ
ncbi:MAG: VCBS repeat-containing protein [Rhodospirillales bacterium]|nr:VCBS repeat-containing protein [Rhodospirillales bacterium]MDH3793243.1 VCBS repeat-containing protein [Rhodospirillales bacterium]MDH3909709.1 VCBS repeat-containing protein [Rhodospirillales bacterium]MDH3916657.1 VCBS repeat-containing protein [Rhodospirillales bacterium]MDH3966038.1 VCBS repeat-containing protein [Rhodospirillales bacterium]